MNVAKKKKGFIEGWNTFLKDLKNQKFVYLLAIPVILYYVIFHYVPMYGAIIAFKNFSIRIGILNSPWAGNYGFEHFINFVNGPYFWRVLTNTLKISIYDIIFGFPAPIIFALLLNELNKERFKKTVQTLTYLPHFISIMVVCGLIVIFTNKAGPISAIISNFTGTRENLLYNADLFLPIYILSGIWQQVGWSSIIYLAALSAVDASLYEAASIDGAGRFRKIFAITIPAIMPTIVTLFILRVGSIMSVGYEKVLLLQNSLTLEKSDVISTFVFRSGILENNYSFSTAVGLMNAVVNFIVLYFANTVSKKVNETSLW